MSELFKAIADFKQRKKFESEKAFANFESVINSTHTATEFSAASREYTRASAEYMAANELLIELIQKGLV